MKEMLLVDVAILTMFESGLSKEEIENELKEHIERVEIVHEHRKEGK